MADNDHKLDKDKLDLDKLVWDEYKYRHELCWSLTFRITIVVATLSIIPYLNKITLKGAGRIAFLTTFIAIYVGYVGIKRLNSELRHLDRVRNIHKSLQSILFPGGKTDEDKGWQGFTREMKTYLWILIGLAILNVFVVSYYYFGWVKNLIDNNFKSFQ